MRLEGFVSLLACVMLLFLIGIGLGALRAELQDLSQATSGTDSPPQRSASR